MSKGVKSRMRSSELGEISLARVITLLLTKIPPLLNKKTQA